MNVVFFEKYVNIFLSFIGSIFLYRNMYTFGFPETFLIGFFSYGFILFSTIFVIKNSITLLFQNIIFNRFIFITSMIKIFFSMYKIPILNSFFFKNPNTFSKYSFSDSNAEKFMIIHNSFLNFLFPHRSNDLFFRIINEKKESTDPFLNYLLPLKTQSTITQNNFFKQINVIFDLNVVFENLKLVLEHYLPCMIKDLFIDSETMILDFKHH